MSYTKWIVGTLVVGGLAVTGWLIYDKQFKKKNPEDKDNSDSNYTGNLQKKKQKPSEKQAPAGDEFPLQLGSKGKRVEQLQLWLLRNYGLHAVVPNELSEKTLSILKRKLGTDKIDKQTFLKYHMDKPVHKQIALK